MMYICFMWFGDFDLNMLWMFVTTVFLYLANISRERWKKRGRERWKKERNRKVAVLFVSLKLRTNWSFHFIICPKTLFPTKNLSFSFLAISLILPATLVENFLLWDFRAKSADQHNFFSSSPFSHVLSKIIAIIQLPSLSHQHSVRALDSVHLPRRLANQTSVISFLQSSTTVNVSWLRFVLLIYSIEFSYF